MTRHDSQRGYFAYALFEEMKKNDDIWLICIDLGYKIFDDHFAAFPDRCINTGAAEQAAVSIAIGLSYEGKIPFVYSITPFLLYRAWEGLRTYIDHEKIPIVLAGSGRDDSYLHDGFSHDAKDVRKILSTLRSINQFYPESNEEVPDTIKNILGKKQPAFISLCR